MSLRSVWFIGIADYTAVRSAGATLDDSLDSHLADGIFERFYRFGDVLRRVHPRDESPVSAHQIDSVIQHTPLQRADYFWTYPWRLNNRLWPFNTVLQRGR